MSDSSSPRATGLPWKKILLTTDFSAESLTAWEQAGRLASIEPMAITVLHVTDPPFQGLRIQSGSEHEEMRKAAAARLAELIAEHFGGHAHVAARVEQGRAATVIGEVAKQSGTDLIVISSHGHSGLKHVVLGSVVEAVVRHAPCLVLVVPARPR
jgi:nucleotide-binding universal stress UspA family protein